MQKASAALQEQAQVNDQAVMKSCAITHLQLPLAQPKVCIFGENGLLYYTSQEMFLKIGRKKGFNELLEAPGFYQVYGALNGTRAIIVLKETTVDYEFTKNPQHWIQKFWANGSKPMQRKLRAVG